MLAFFDLHIQASTNPTKEQLIKAVKQHFSSQVPLSRPPSPNRHPQWPERKGKLHFLSSTYCSSSKLVVNLWWNIVNQVATWAIDRRPKMQFSCRKNARARAQSNARSWCLRRRINSNTFPLLIQQQVDEIQVITEFVRAAKRLKSLDRRWNSISKIRSCVPVIYVVRKYEP